MQKSYVLITGASGFIGSYLVPYLLARDYGVIGLSRQKKIHLIIRVSLGFSI